MKIVKLIFSRTYRKSILKKFSDNEMIRNCIAENDLENIYANINMSTQGNAV